MANNDSNRIDKTVRRFRKTHLWLIVLIYVCICAVFGLIFFLLEDVIEKDFMTSDSIVMNETLMTYLEDLKAVFISFFASFAVMVFFLLAASAVISFLKQQSNLRLYFRDTVTHGNNWNYFVFMGERILRSRRFQNNNYAVVHLVFVKYRNYVVCHSVEDGEELLRQVYDLINYTVARDEICVRSTTSNFALLLRYSTAENLKERLEALINSLSRISGDHDFTFQAGVSLVSSSHRKSPDIETDYNKACTARETFNDSEESGVVFFDKKLLDDRRWEELVSENSRLAIRNEEFQVYYQPKYDPNNDTLKGAEALIRWDSPEFGFISPGKFIPIFEKNGFITQIDHYMISHVARDQARWIKEGYKCVPVSVNVSRAHFVENDLAEQIRDMVDKEGAPRNLIEIELTESAFFDDKKALVGTILKLKEYGFSVSMDDFGSGYSSLNSLKDMPLDILKLDAEFFRGEEAENRGRLVVSETIKLAKSLQMKTVAEGVEEKELVDFLAESGCDMIQGYFYAKPMPGAEYEDRMRVGVYSRAKEEQDSPEIPNENK